MWLGSRRSRGRSGVPTCPNAGGGRYAKITATMAMRGATSATIKHVHAPTTGGEDGLAGFSDERQQLCFALALWNGRDPIVKERLFGLTNSEGNHGEDVKEYYFYLDSTPTHSYMKWLYKYPQGMEVSDRSPLEGSPVVIRVLPRRQRSRPGGQPSDGLDRVGRETHPALRLPGSKEDA